MSDPPGCIGTADSHRRRHSPNTPNTGLRERGNDASKSTGRSGRQNAATRRNMRREERVTVQGPVKEQQPDRMSHMGGTLPFDPPPPLTQISQREKPKFTKGNIDLGYFWYTNF